MSRKFYRVEYDDITYLCYGEPHELPCGQNPEEWVVWIQELTGVQVVNMFSVQFIEANGLDVTRLGADEKIYYTLIERGEYLSRNREDLEKLLVESGHLE